MGTTDDEIESSGRRLADKSDTWLVGFASRGGAAAEAIEMQRRFLVAIREFNQKSRQQITSLSWVTVAVGTIAALQCVLVAPQLWATLSGMRD